jgi:hypothetical protein
MSDWPGRQLRIAPHERVGLEGEALKKFLTIGNRMVTVTIWLRTVVSNATLSSERSPIRHGEKSWAFSVADGKRLEESLETFA